MPMELEAHSVARLTLVSHKFHEHNRAEKNLECKFLCKAYLRALQ